MNGGATEKASCPLRGRVSAGKVSEYRDVSIVKLVKLSAVFIEIVAMRGRW